MPSLEQSFLDRWIRRGLITSVAAGFTLPYFRLLNRVHATGDAILDTLPRRASSSCRTTRRTSWRRSRSSTSSTSRTALPLENPFVRFSAATETMEKNLVTQIFTKAGGVTFRRSFREGGRDVKRSVDFEGVAKVEEAIASGWLLHFPAGTTQKSAPLRPGVALLLHRTKAIAVPLRVDGFRDLLLHKQIPGKILRRCHLTLHPPMDLDAFYAAPYDKDAGAEVVGRLSAILADPG